MALYDFSGKRALVTGAGKGKMIIQYFESRFIAQTASNSVQLLTNVETLFEGFEIKTQLTVL